MEKVLQLELTKEETRKKPTTRATPAFKITIAVGEKTLQHPGNRPGNEYTLMTNEFFYSCKCQYNITQRPGPSEYNSEML